MLICHLTLQSGMEALQEMQEVWNVLTETEDAPSDWWKEWELIGEELLVNIIHYAHRHGGEQWIDCEIEVSQEKLLLTIRDHGAPFNPWLHDHPDIGLSWEARKIGGLGIHLVKQMTDTREYVYCNGQNVIRLTKFRKT